MLKAALLAREFLKNCDFVHATRGARRLLTIRPALVSPRRQASQDQKTAEESRRAPWTQLASLADESSFSRHSSTRLPRGTANQTSQLTYVFACCQKVNAFRAGTSSLAAELGWRISCGVV